MTQFLVIGVGGFLGANCRYLIGGWAAERFGSVFPYGTMIINVTGSFLIGIFLTVLSDRFVPMPNLRLFFAVGFLGAYTTFSTFSWETLSMIESRAYAAAAANIVGGVMLGMVAVAAGVVIGRVL